MAAKSKSNARSASKNKKATTTAASAKKQQKREVSVEQEEASSGRKSISYSVSRVEALKKQVFESYVVGIIIFGAWFAPLFNGISIWKLMSGATTFTSALSNTGYSQEETTALNIAAVSLFASLMAIMLNNRHLTAFLTLVGCLITFAIAFLHTEPGFSWAAKKKMFDCQFLGCAFWIYLALNAVLQYEFRK